MFKKAEKIQKQIQREAGDKMKRMQIGKYHITTKCRLAEGGFGFVDLVNDNLTKNEYVLKRCNAQHQDSMDNVTKEVCVLQSFESPYIVKILGTDFITNKTGGKEALILMEYCSGGHLLERLMKRQGKSIPEKMCFRFFQQLLTAMKCLHDSDPYIVHRDLKLENVLLAHDGSLRLCDFGSCVFGPVSIRTPAERAEAESIINKETTPIYRAPELIDLYMREELTEKTDIWALGCIFYAMCYLKTPFQEGQTLKVLSDKIPYPSSETVTANSMMCLKRMLDFDAEARPSVGEMLAACECVACDLPVPHLRVNEVAQQRRAQREAAANKAPNLTAMKRALRPVIAARSSESAGISSAATRRLAAMKGTTEGHQLSAPLAAAAAAAAEEAFPIPMWPIQIDASTRSNPELSSPALLADSTDIGFGEFCDDSNIAFESGFPELSTKTVPIDLAGIFDDEFTVVPSSPIAESPLQSRHASVSLQSPMQSRPASVRMLNSSTEDFLHSMAASIDPVVEVDYINMDMSSYASISLLDWPMTTSSKTTSVISTPFLDWPMTTSKTTSVISTPFLDWPMTTSKTTSVISTPLLDWPITPSNTTGALSLIDTTICEPFSQQKLHIPVRKTSSTFEILSLFDTK